MPSNAEKLDVEDRKQIQGLVNHLQHALEQTATADLVGLLPPVGDRLRLPAVRELVRADLDFHWHRHQPVILEDYFDRLPELKDDRALCLDLLHAEYEIRRHYGDSLSLKKLQARFPDLFPQLQQLIAECPADDWLATAVPQGNRPAEPPPPVKKPGTAVASDAWNTLNDPVPAPPRPASPPPAEVPAVMTSDGSGKVLPIIGGYKLLARLGSGSYGQVWRAEAPGGVEVALKIIFRPLDHADARREREALELLSRLHHPFLVATHQFYALEDRLLIAMDLADGSLRDRLKECRAAGQPGIPPDELLRYLGETAEALDYLHDHQVLHRDIKPDNILLFQGHARVADFGLARMLEITGSRQATTTGTPAYMAPEVWKAEINAHSDQYSLAATYVELRLGHPMFASSSMMQLMLDHLERTPNLETLPQAEQEVLRKALAKNPHQRYHNCREFHRALAHALAPSPAEPPAQPQPKPVWRRRLAVAGLMMAVLLALAVWRFSAYFYQDVGSGPAPGPAAYLPPHCEPEGQPGTQVSDGRTLYEKIAYVLPDGTRVVFVLVPRGVPKELPAFYILRDKVTYGLFQKFVTANPQAVTNQDWQRGTNLKGTFLPPQENDPVYRVTAVEATRFADWLGGKLPTVRQWDKAAGRFEPGAEEPGRGPFRAPWDPKDPEQIAVGRDRPMPGGSATHDESPFHCRDMAGNGLEWTRNLVLRDERLPPQYVSPDTKDLNSWVSLRGKSYRSAEPYTFDNSVPDQERVGSAKDDVGFRVVLELPAEAGPDGLPPSADHPAAGGTGP